MPSSGPSNGSHDRNRTVVGTQRRSLTRYSASLSSTDTPIHRFGGQSKAGGHLPQARGPLRQDLIRVLRRVGHHSEHGRSMKPTGTLAWKRSLIELTNTTLGTRQA